VRFRRARPCPCATRAPHIAPPSGHGDDDERFVELATQRADEFHHGLGIFAIEIASRFVGQHERRIGYDGPRDGDPLFLPAAQLPGQMVFAICESHHLERGHDLLVAPAAVEWKKKQGEFDILVGGKDWHQIEGLKDVTDISCAPGRKLILAHFRAISPVHDHFARGRRIDPSHEIKQRRLAAAAWPHQSKKLSGGHLKSHPFKHIELLATTPIDFVNAANFDDWIHGAVELVSLALLAALFSRKVTLTLMSGRRFCEVSWRRIFAWIVFFERDARGRIRETSAEKALSGSASRVTSTDCPTYKRATSRWLTSTHICNFAGS
jgi:hypothetical protein